MFEEIIKKLYEIDAPLGGNTATPVAGEFALHEAERVFEQGLDTTTAVGAAVLKFLSFSNNNAELAVKFKEILEKELEKARDNWQGVEVVKSLRGLWLLEAQLIKNKEGGD